jgi:hypothetical protein
MLRAGKIVGCRIEKVLEIPIPSATNSQWVQIVVQLSGVGRVFLDQEDPTAPPLELRLYDGNGGKTVSNPDVESIIGHFVADVIVSEYLASVSFVIDDGRILTNDILDFGNFASVVSHAAFLCRGEYISLCSLHAETDTGC